MYKMIVSFIYRFKGDPKIYYGKYIGYVSDDYEEGLDREIAIILMNPLKEELKRRYIDSEDPSSIIVGVLGCDRDIKDYFSETEKDIFDLLFCNWSNQNPEFFLNGHLIKY
jgi:hypothetical protein